MIACVVHCVQGMKNNTVTYLIDNGPNNGNNATFISNSLTKTEITNIKYTHFSVRVSINYLTNLT